MNKEIIAKSKAQIKNKWLETKEDEIDMALNIIDDLEIQCKKQQEFIKWLEGYLEKNGYDYGRQSFSKTKLNVVGATLSVVLQKYKEIIGDDKNENNNI